MIRRCSLSKGVVYFGRLPSHCNTPSHFSTFLQNPTRAACHDMNFPMETSRPEAVHREKRSLSAPTRQLVPRGRPTEECSHFAIKRTLNAVGVCADPIPNPSSPLSGLESTFYRSVFGGFRLKSNKLISGTHAVA